MSQESTEPREVVYVLVDSVGFRIENGALQKSCSLNAEQMDRIVRVISLPQVVSVDVNRVKGAEIYSLFTMEKLEGPSSL